MQAATPTAPAENRIAIIGDDVAINDDEAVACARKLLDWNGDSEADYEPLEVSVRPEYDLEADAETGRFQVVTDWGAKAKEHRDFSEGEVIATYDTREAAEEHAERHNNAAIETIIRDAAWMDIPIAASTAWVRYSRGNYPQTRYADVSVCFGDPRSGVELEAFASGTARYISDSACPSAAQSALRHICEAVNAAKLGYYEGRRQNALLRKTDRADVVRLVRMIRAAA